MRDRDGHYQHCHVDMKWLNHGRTVRQATDQTGVLRTAAPPEHLKLIIRSAQVVRATGVYLNRSGPIYGTIAKAYRCLSRRPHVSTTVVP